MLKAAAAVHLDKAARANKKKGTGTGGTRQADLARTSTYIDAARAKVEDADAFALSAMLQLVQRPPDYDGARRMAEKALEHDRDSLAALVVRATCRFFGYTVRREQRGKSVPVNVPADYDGARHDLDPSEQLKRGH